MGTEVHARTEEVDDIIDGNLVGQFGTAQIVRGVPRFVADEGYTHSFGLQWNRYRETQLDSVSGFTRSHNDFTSNTGIEPADWHGKRVLDVGCGAGRFTELFANAGATVVAVDRSTAVEAASKNVGHRPGVHVAQADLFSLPFADCSFDLVFSIGVLHHTPSAERGLRALTRLPRAGGILAVWLYATSPFPWGDWIDDRWRALTQRLPPDILFNLARSAVPLGGALRTVQQIPFVGGRAVALYSSLLPKVSLDSEPEWRILDTFDWWSPRYRSFHTYEQVEGWLRSEGIVDIERISVPVALRGRRPAA